MLLCSYVAQNCINKKGNINSRFKQTTKQTINGKGDNNKGSGLQSMV